MGGTAGREYEGAVPGPAVEVTGKDGAAPIGRTGGQVDPEAERKAPGPPGRPVGMEVCQHQGGVGAVEPAAVGV